ncbi:prolyl oligopeptidase family serine peptidase [Corynebacterium lizhenjunii]|uniref:Prolyl oligopeptidase family serine peptidase n=1 Tax=Corynebacterium lizhenjunii TaxID=2709394 RepID=A0A7T0KED0_9CORY|nr:PHB depolymerase family esterase [Corynebacterium lizhenjunii]QPK78579.1 prolyl oligopeptidase family serine peptidase [Corynebacterium lizhenjunii]
MTATKLAAITASLTLAITALAPAANAQSSVPQLSSNPAGSSAAFKDIADALNGLAGGIGNAGSTHRTTRTINVPGQGQRSYLLSLPAGHNGISPTPVLFGFSGWTHSAEQGAGYMNLERAAGNEAIVVYPQPRANASGTLGWEGPSYAPTRRGEDVDFARAIVDQLNRDYAIDRSRIYATGLSNGGGMALNLACQAPETFAAVAGVATASYTPIFDGCRGQVPTLLIHGTNDDIARYANDGIGQGGPYYSTREAWRRIGERNLCNTTNNLRVSQGNGYESFAYSNCLADTVLYRVNGGTHTWFASNPAATQEVWNFLRTR